jgi:hypothetical protein
MKFKTIAVCCIVAIAAIVLASTVSAEKKQSSEDYTNHPGYVDFNMLDIFGDKEAKVEVSLKQPMLKLVSEYTKNDDPELFDMLNKLAVVRVYVFDADENVTSKFDTESSKMVKMLTQKGWERVVRVRDNDDHVYVYLKPSSNYDYIEGIVVLAVDKGDEAVFVNIAGEIRPEDVSSLGHHFGINDLEGINTQKKQKD